MSLFTVKETKDYTTKTFTRKDGTKGQRKRYGSVIRAKAKILVNGGTTLTAIANELNTSIGVVGGWCNPKPKSNTLEQDNIHLTDMVKQLTDELASVQSELVISKATIQLLKEGYHK